MRAILPNKTEFIPHAPQNEHEIFMAMRTYPDNVKVYHPHGSIDATSVFWHNKLHPNALNFAVYVDLTTKHFRLVQTALTATVDLGGLSLNAPTASGALKTFAEVSSQDSLYQSVLERSMREYAGKPTFNPAITMPLPDWSALISHRQISTAPFALIQDDQLAAFSFLYDLGEHSVELGQMNATNAQALNELLNRQLQWLQDNYQTLAGEFGMANRLEMKIFQSLPFKDVNKYETYMRLT